MNVTQLRVKEKGKEKIWKEMKIVNRHKAKRNKPNAKQMTNIIYLEEKKRKSEKYTRHQPLRFKRKTDRNK